jgi:hypothetical protein
MVSPFDISVKPPYIVVYAGARLALRMTGKIGSFRTLEMFCLVVIFQAGVTGAVDED